jgi:hypothetical protein
MRKRLGALAGVVAMVMALLLVGCGDDGGDDPVVRTPSTSPSQSSPPGTDY